MISFIVTLVAAGAGYLLGTWGAKRAIDEQIDARFAEFRDELQPQLAAPAVAAAPSQPAPAQSATPSSATEIKAAPVPSPAPVPVPVPVPAKEVKPAVVEEEISPEILAVLSTAICAFLGKPARIRRVRRLPGGLNPWAQVGRVSVMASHALTRQH